MLEDDALGDEGVIGLVGMMWQITITVIQLSKEVPEKDKPHKFLHLNFRHNRALRKVDVVLIFAGENHYLVACKYLISFKHFLF